MLALATAGPASAAVEVQQVYSAPGSQDQDDMCLWTHPSDPALSTVITSDKVAGKIFVYDLDGTPRTTSLVDYQLPAASEVPSIVAAGPQVPAATNALGVRGIGENGAIAATAAVDRMAARRTCEQGCCVTSAQHSSRIPCASCAPSSSRLASAFASPTGPGGR